MPKTDRLSGGIDWIELEFPERERTPEPIIEVGIQLHLAELSLLNTKQYLETLGVQRSRTAIHNWVLDAGLQPNSDVNPNHVAVDETAIQVNNQRHWLYAAVDSESNQLLHVRLFHTRTTQLTVAFLRELRRKHDLDQTTVLVDDAHHLKATLDRLGLRFQVVRHGNRNSIERVFREVKRRTLSFANTFSNAPTTTVESWLHAFAVWYNRCQS